MFVRVDDFCQHFEKQWHKQLLQEKATSRLRKGRLCLSEIMTIVIGFQSSRFRDFKAYYRFLEEYHRCEFPGLVSYNRFVQLMPRTLIPLCAYLRGRRGRVTGISFIDSTAIAVCHNRRISRNRVFRGLAQRGKTSLDWFLGFKVHLIINECGELLAFQITPGNVDVRKPVPQMVKGLSGKLFGDKGYLSQPLFEQLFNQGLAFFTTRKRNMKPQLLSLYDKILLRKRALIETVNEQLKSHFQLEHTRHRSSVNFMINLVAALVAYSHQPNKPHLNLSNSDLQLLSLFDP